MQNRRAKQNELSHARTYSYDGYGRLDEYTDRNGRITRYEYDRLHQLSAEKWYLGTSHERTISYDFDAVGNLESVSDPSAATYSYAYDALNQLTASTQTITGLTPTIDFFREYDEAGRLVYSAADIGNTDDYVNEYAYDALGRLVQLTQHGVTNGNAVADKRVDFTYLRDGQFDLISRYANLAGTQLVANSDYGYDAAGRLTSLAHTRNSTTFAGYGFTYDDANRLTTVTNSQYTAENATYSYDNRGQLTGADRSGTSSDETYDYDANGNRESDHTGTFTIGPDNRVYGSPSSESYPFTYTYDFEGNRIEKFIDEDDNGHLNSADTVIEIYTWDHRNRLTRIEFEDIGRHDPYKSIEYGYDAFNQLVRRKEDPDGTYGSTAVQQTIFVHDGGQVALQFDKTDSGDLAASNLSHRYLWGPAVDQLFADEQTGGEVLWTLADHLGSVRDLIDSAGDLQNHKSYDAFGNVISETNAAVDTVFGYTGKLFDDDTGLQNNLHRWYDPTIGRWLSQDPIGFAAGDANLYR